jgi:hypothetical protein
MTPRWYRTRWFWLGLLGFVLWVGAWVGSFAGGSGHAWNWSGSKRYYFFSHGGGWMGAGVGESMAVRYPSLKGMNGWRHSKWNLQVREKVSWFPPVQFKIEQGNTSLWIHYGVWIATWSVAWLVPLACRHFPRRSRAPRFPGSPRRWFASPFLWAGLPGFVMLIVLWLDSSSYRSHASWRWTRGLRVQPRYLGFGVESNRSQVAVWAGLAYEGFLFRSQKTGPSGDRLKSTGTFFLPESKVRKGARRFQTSYLALASIYLLLWAGMAASWQYRQSRLRHRPAAPP